MKKNLLCVSLLTFFAAGFMGCTQQQKWNENQRMSMREALRDYRQMVYLEDLSDDEFMFFADGVTAELEDGYPVYTEFIQIPGMTDTVEMVVVATIIDELNADVRNIRHIYPYSYLVAQGTLPAGLDHDQQHAFYKCFAGKIDSTYTTMGQFFTAVMADTTDLSQIHQMESQCANKLFDWTMTEVDIIDLD